MAFLDDLGDSLIGKTSNKLSITQQNLQQQALNNNASNKSYNLKIIIGVIIVLISILGFITYLLTKTKTS